MKYDALFTPFSIGKMEVKNRLVMSPMGTNSSHIDGTIADDEIDYFERRAKGGVGLIIMGCQFLNPELAQGSLEGVLQNTYVIPQLTSVVEASHRYGAKICCQISCGTGRNAFPNMMGEPPFSSSETPWTFNPEIKCRKLSKEQIKDIMKEFANSAKIAMDAGFDAIEIHAHAGYLVDQFMSPVWNIRDDEYGGSAENRMRFPCEIVESIKSVVGDKLPVIFRISLDHMFEGGRTLEESMELIKILENAGVDALDIDSGCYETIDYIFPSAYTGDACMMYVCDEARKHVSIPLMNSGNHTPDSALDLVTNNKADFAMFGRQLIADPDMPNKLMEGDTENIRPCIRCNEECVGRIVTRLTKLSCAVNPTACDERRLALEDADKVKNVVVIGAGPGGLEAARVAALRGHKVSVYEKDNKIGGQLAVAATPKFKDQLKKLVAWFELQLKNLDVTVHLNHEVTIDDEILKNADEIIIGSGATPITPNINGIDKSISVIDAHVNKDTIKGDTIIMCGGGLSGCDSAIELASEHNKKIKIVEMEDAIAKDVMFINAASIFRDFSKYGIEQHTNSKIVEILDDGVMVEDKDGNKQKIEGDTVISAFGMFPSNKLAKEIQSKYPKHTNIIGDSLKIGKVADAIRSGYYAGSRI